MDVFFNPASVAIIGVSEKPDNMARNMVANLQSFAFNGLIYAVGINGGRIFGHRIYKSVSDIPDEIDLAVILTPADTVADLIAECGQKGIRRVIIESAGFNEFGEEGKKREKKVISAAKKHNIRFIGPNCIGTMNLHNGLVLPFLKFNDVFTRGKVSIVSQSGGVAFTFLNLLSGESIGISKIASIGNKINVDENDIIEYLLSDDETDIIIVYLEGVSGGKRLMNLARSSHKPILLHKANIGALGRKIAASHTAALSSDDAVVDAALKQAGIARFRNRTTLVNYLKILPMPRIKGNRLAILSRSGGHAILAADAAETTGFCLAEFGPSFIREIRTHMRANVINLTNPLDLGDLFDYDIYLKIIERTVQEKDVDGVIFLHSYFSVTEGEVSRRLIEKTRELSFKYEKPIVVCVATDEEEIYKLRKHMAQPVFTSPLEIVSALALSRDFHCGGRSSPEKITVSADRKKVRAIINACKKKKRSPLITDGLEIFSAYGIPTVESRLAKSEKEAAVIAEKLGFPVALKISSCSISHKSDVGGVQLNLKSVAHVREAYREIMASVRKKIRGAKVDGAIIQRMMKDGWEIILGAKRDPNFGSVVLAGFGGTFVEIFRDVAMRIVPFSKPEAEEMVRGLKGFPILIGSRGGEGYDIGAIVEGIMKLQALIEDFPEIQEIDINPFYTLQKGGGAMALDARIILLGKGSSLDF